MTAPAPTHAANRNSDLEGIMAIWNKLRSELDRAGRAAHEAFDEGKLRLDVFRARQLVDRAAQALGYAVYRSRTGLESIDEAALARLTDAVQEREREVAAIEERIRQASKRGGDGDASRPTEPPTAASSGEPSTGGAAGGESVESTPPLS